MSKQNLQEIACPDCKQKQTVIYWNSINVKLDPELREQLFDGQINVFRCESCGASAPLATHLMYHDMTRQFCATYYPFSSLREPETLDGFNAEGKPRMDFFGPLTKMAEMVPNYMRDQHVVFDMNELLRYITFREAIYERQQQSA